MYSNFLFDTTSNFQQYFQEVFFIQNYVVPQCKTVVSISLSQKQYKILGVLFVVFFFFFVFFNFGLVIFSLGVLSQLK